MAYCTQTDLEYAVGGAAALAQLLDKDGDGYADAGFVSRILDRASAEVASAIQVSQDLSSLSAPYPNALVYVTANIGAYYAWLEGAQGETMSDSIRENYQEALRWLDQVARKERTLGIAPRPATGQQVEQIDPDPNGDRVSRTSLIGFW